jgi:phosphatidate cytidylyltransferase
MKNLIQRAITGFLFVAIIVGSLFVGRIAFSALFMIVTAMTLWEFYTLVNQGDKATINQPAATTVGLILYISASLWHYSTTWAIAIIGLYIVGCLFIVIYELFHQKGNPLHNWAYFIVGQVYIVIPFLMLNVLNNLFDRNFLLALFVLIWTYDSGAYLFGVTLGKHRLFERISPKKSWEGAIGGFLAACGIALIFAHFSPSLPIVSWLGFTALIVVFGTFGDLSESLLKRTFNIKDSGNILPGHGGMLDRFDSLLFATPVILFYLLLLLKDQLPL